MIKLVIKDKGFFIELPRVAPFRTPAVIDISNINLNLIITKLKKAGITNYEIKSGESSEVKTKRSKPVEKSESPETFKGLKERFDKFEELLQEIVNKELPSEAVKTVKDFGKEVRIEEIEKESEFIPDIDISRMKIRSSGFKIEKSDGSIGRSVSLLSRKISKKKEE